MKTKSTKKSATVAVAIKKPEPRSRPKPSASRAKAEAEALKPKVYTPARLASFKETLREKHRELLHAFNSTKGESRDRGSDGTEDYIDYAVSSYDREFLLSLTELEQKQLRLVEEALKRVERRSEFGRCLQCGNGIPEKRLEVQPWSRFCLTCQELDEQGLLTDSYDLDDDDEDEVDSAEDDDDDDDDDDEDPV